MLKLEKSQYLNSIFQLNITKYEKKVMIQNCLLYKDLQVWIATFFHKMFFFLFDLKKYSWKSKIQFFNNNMWSTEKPFHLKSKTNLATLRKCNSHLQYYEIDFNLSMKLQEINLYVCEEYKIEHEARRSNRAPTCERSAYDRFLILKFVSINSKEASLFFLI